MESCNAPGWEDAGPEEVPRQHWLPDAIQGDDTPAL